VLWIGGNVHGCADWLAILRTVSRGYSCEVAEKRGSYRGWSNLPEKRAHLIRKIPTRSSQDAHTPWQRHYSGDSINLNMPREYFYNIFKGQ